MFKRNLPMLEVHQNLKDEVKIINSGIRKVFTPHTPINELAHFFGRDEEVKRIISVITSPGQHILLFGDRGVGKTSLVNTTCNLILENLNKALNKGKTYSKSCDRSDTFSSLFHQPLIDAGINIFRESESKRVQHTGNASVNIAVAKGELISEHESSTVNTKQNNLESPSWVADKLRKLDGILLLDEVDTLSDPEDKRKLAEMIKLLSDFNSRFKIVLVGIAKTANELTAGHESVQRCLKEIHLERMSDDDIKKIVVNGMNKIGKIPTDEVVDKIVNISSGFPHFTHLICLKCAETAVATNKTHIEMVILDQALEEASRDSEGTLSNTLDTMLRSTNIPQEYKLILLAASYCQKRDFRSSELSVKMKELFDIDISSQTLSARLSKLTKTYNNAAILTKTAIGCFTFSDPRMPSFIKILFNSSNRVVTNNV